MTLLNVPSPLSATRKHGAPPYRLAVLHGGPGAPGSATPIARELASSCSVLEPLQSARALSGQLSELREQLQQHAQLPLTLIGWSYGALLGYLFAAANATLVRKLVLVAAPALTTADASSIRPTQDARLDATSRARVAQLRAVLDTGANAASRDLALATLATLLRRAEVFDPIDSLPDDPVQAQHDLNQSLWNEVIALRDSGELLERGRAIRCATVLIQGEHDARPSAAISAALAGVVADFRYIALPRCGHYPWLERQARTEFFDLLRAEVL